MTVHVRLTYLPPELARISIVAASKPGAWRSTISSTAGARLSCGPPMILRGRHKGIRRDFPFGHGASAASHDGLFSSPGTTSPECQSDRAWAPGSPVGRQGGVMGRISSTRSSTPSSAARNSLSAMGAQLGMKPAGIGKFENDVVVTPGRISGPFGRCEDDAVGR